MVRLKDIQLIVQFVLGELPETRNSDNLLYYHVVKMWGQKLGINVDTLSFSEVFNSKTTYPKYESVSRARRKVQEDNPQLRACANVEAGRMIEEEKFKEYARG